MEQTIENKPYYFGHRERLRKRFVENGIDSLFEHEILELLLFYSIPRVDTKPLAHKLIAKYGSLKNVLEASYESLKENSLTDRSALLIVLLKEIDGWLVRNEIIGKKADDYNETGSILVQELDGCVTEKLVALLLDSKNNILELENVCEGSFKSAKVHMRNLVQKCLERNAAKVILAHNHPSGDIRPSSGDHVTTASIGSFLESIEVELVEHYIVADGTFLGIKRHSMDVKKSIEEEYKMKFGLNGEL